MNRSELIELLKTDKEIKNLIFKIVGNNETEYVKQEIPEREKLEDLIKRTYNLLEEKIEKLKLKEKEIRTLTENLTVKSSEIKSLNEYLSKKQIEIEKINESMNLKEKIIVHLETKIKEREFQLKNTNDKNIKLTSEIKKVKNKLQEYELKFKEDLEVYKVYLNLLPQTKESLKGIFKDSTLQGFLSCGVQDKNIGNLWEYIKDEIIEGENKDIKSLKVIFEYLFSKYKKAFPMFEKQEINIGDSFDNINYIKHNSSTEISGEISEVILVGWVNKKTEKIIKQSIVKVGR